MKLWRPCSQLSRVCIYSTSARERACGIGATYLHARRFRVSQFVVSQTPNFAKVQLFAGPLKNVNACLILRALCTEYRIKRTAKQLYY